MRDLKDLQAYWHGHTAEDLMLCTIVGKTGSDRVETVHDTVRRQQVEVERVPGKNPPAART